MAVVVKWQLRSIGGRGQVAVEVKWRWQWQPSGGGGGVAVVLALERAVVVADTLARVVAVVV